MRQQHAAGTDPNTRGRGGDERDENLGRRACQRLDGMMLRDPVALIAEPIDQARQFDRIVKRLRRGGAGGNRSLVDNRKLHHCLQ